MRVVRCVAALVLVLLIASPARAANKQVFLRDGAFYCSASSSSCAIDQGDTVFWNTDSGAPVTVTADDGSWSGSSHTFSTPGTFGYHAGDAKGSFTVRASSNPPPPPPPPPPAATTKPTSQPATTVRDATATTTTAYTGTTLGFDALATTSTVETTTTIGQIAIKEKDSGGGGVSGVLIAALALPALAVLGGGGWLLYRLGGSRAAAGSRSGGTRLPKR